MRYGVPGDPGIVFLADGQHIFNSLYDRRTYLDCLSLDPSVLNSLQDLSFRLSNHDALIWSKNLLPESRFI